MPGYLRTQALRCVPCHFSRVNQGIFGVGAIVNNEFKPVVAKDNSAGDRRAIRQMRKEGGQMFWLKCCPRCQGDLYEDKDTYGRYVACMQCGRVINPLVESEADANKGFVQPQVLLKKSVA